MAATLLARVTGARVPEAARAPLAVLPAGSIEYHGPHGPLGADLFLAEALAARVADTLGGLLLPALPYAHCPPATASHAGTINIAERTMVLYLTDLLAGLFAMGVRGVLVLNAHDGNARPLQTAGDILAERHPDRFVLWVNWWEALPAAEMEEARLFSQDGGHGHGGPLEMSATDAAQPGSVDWAAARDLDVVFPPGGRLVRAAAEGRPLPNWEGYHGRATEGSQAKGERLLDMAARRIVEQTRAWLAELSQAGPP